MAGMTKSRYVLIAEAINKTRPVGPDESGVFDAANETIDDVAHAIADALAQDNPAFKRSWFLAIAGAVHCQACGDTLDSYGRSATFLGMSQEEGQQKGDTCPRTESGQHIPSEPL